MIMKHPEAQELALFVSRDLSAWRNFAISRHVAGCAACRREVALLGNASSAFATEVDLIPGGAAAWEQLAAEMRANIRLGLEAGECVGDALPSELDPLDEAIAAAPARPAGWYAGWNPARWWNSAGLSGRLHLDSGWTRAISAGVAVVVVSTGLWWWQRSAFEPMSAYFSNEPAAAAVAGSAQMARETAAAADADVVFRTVSDGLVVERGAGRSLTLAHTGRAATGLTVSLKGSMTAEYVDDDSAQVTIHHVYAE